MLTHEKIEKSMEKPCKKPPFPQVFFWPPDLVQQQWLEPTAAWQYFWIMTDANGGFSELYLTIVYLYVTISFFPVETSIVFSMFGFVVGLNFVFSLKKTDGS